MKKSFIIGLVFILSLIITGPAIALDVEFSGFYRVRGFCVHDYETFGYTGGSLRMVFTVTFSGEKISSTCNIWSCVMEIPNSLVIFPSLLSSSCALQVTKKAAFS